MNRAQTDSLISLLRPGILLVWLWLPVLRHLSGGIPLAVRGLVHLLALLLHLRAAHQHDPRYRSMEAVE